MKIFTDKKSGDQYVIFPTRLPAKMQMYMKNLAFSSGRSLYVMYDDMAERFFREEPWNHGLKWRLTKGLTTTVKGTMGEKSPTGWMQINMRFSADMGHRLEQLSMEQNASMSSLTYTMIYWWTWWIYPPSSERARREAFLRRNG